MWSALLGAVVGGALTLVGVLAIEVRRERRDVISAARMVASELQRAAFRIDVYADNDHEDPPPVGSTRFHGGPHSDIQSVAWPAQAVRFITRLSEEEFESIDRLESRIAYAGQFGFHFHDESQLIEEATEAAATFARFAKPTWFDRHIWRL